MGPCARPGVCIQCVAGLCLCRVSHIGARHVVSARCVHRYRSVVSSMTAGRKPTRWAGVARWVRLRVARIARLDAF